MLPKQVKSFLPPTLLTLSSGKWAVFGGNWIQVPNSTTFEQVQAVWVKDVPKKVSEPIPNKNMIYNVPSSKGTSSYQVEFKNNSWSCTCPGFGFRSKCRHIDNIKQNFRK